jgi:hypothetical protein
MHYAVHLLQAVDGSEHCRLQCSGHSQQRSVAQDMHTERVRERLSDLLLLLPRSCYHVHAIMHSVQLLGKLMAG